jgi:hypothetical protein
LTRISHAFDAQFDLKEKKKMYACGTVRKDRKGLPDNFKSDKRMMRGDSDWWMPEKGVVSMSKWMDKKWESIFYLTSMTPNKQLLFKVKAIKIL